MALPVLPCGARVRAVCAHLTSRSHAPFHARRYTWIVVLAGLFAFFTSFGIGANDVANAFATSVGSKALTIRKAMVIAGIFEFSGALLLGSSVSDTIRSGIADVNCFVDMPAVLMWGMCCVCLATGTWLLIATYLELPVSTTHSCVGGVVGFALVAVGSDCVTWSARSSEFPFVKGVSSIVLSWFFSPVLSALVSMAMYFSVRTFILRSPNSTERAFLFFPLLIAFTVMMCAFYITLKGERFRVLVYSAVHPCQVRILTCLSAQNLSKFTGFLSSRHAPTITGTKKVNELWDFDAEGEDLWLTCVICIGSGLIAALFSLFLRPTIRRAIDDTPEEDELKHGPVPADAAVTVPVSAVEKPPAPSKVGVLDWLRHTLDTETDMLVADSARVANMHAIAEKFPRKTEVVFKYMQIMTASFDSFAHGANGARAAFAGACCASTCSTAGSLPPACRDTPTGPAALRRRRERRGPVRRCLVRLRAEWQVWQKKRCWHGHVLDPRHRRLRHCGRPWSIRLQDHVRSRCEAGQSHAEPRVRHRARLHVCGALGLALRHPAIHDALPGRQHDWRVAAREQHGLD